MIPDNSPSETESARFSPEIDAEGQRVIREELRILREVSGHLAELLPHGMRVSYDPEMLELRDALGEAREEDVPQLIALMESLASLADHHQHDAEARPLRPDSPYFGHLRIAQEGKERDILIGNSSLFDRRLPCPIVDWRHSPISKLFYLYREGDAFEEEMGGKPVSGEILLHRTLMVEGGLLVRVQSEQGTFRLAGEEWVPVARPFPVLQGGGEAAVLPSAGKSPRLGVDHAGQPREDRRLPEITALIDPDQFELIIRPESGVVVVDGGAGSGKTTIALHRIAYLAFRDPERFAPRTMMAVVFNRALSRYISRLLPTLGVEGVPIEVYEELAERLRQRHYPQMIVSYSETTPLAVFRFKQHPAALALLGEAAERWERDFLAQVAAALERTDSAERFQAAWASLAELPLAPRLERLSRWVAGRLRLPAIGSFGKDWLARQRLVPILAEALPDLHAPQSLPEAIWGDAFLHLERLREAMARLAPGVFTSAQIEEIHGWALRGYQQRETYAAWRQERRGEPEAEREEGEGVEPPPDPPQLDREDDTLLLHLYRVLVGPLRSRKQRPLRVSHLMIDEVQDFGLLELRLLLDLAEPPRSVTLAGDAAQRISLHGGFDSWEAALAELGLERHAVAPLRVGYRSTREIMAFATHVLGEQAPDRPWIATRSGAPVELLRCSDAGQAVAVLGESLRRLAREEPRAYVALIARYPEQADLYHAGLAQAELPRLRRVAEQDFAFEPGIEVTDVYQVKGLEFDYVILLDCDEATYPDDPLSRHLLHLGATRAAHQLWLVACRVPSPLLPPGLSQALEGSPRIG